MKILILADGLRLHTGFAQVVLHAAAAFVAAGHEVHQLACLDVPPFVDSRPYQAAGVTAYFPPGHDLIGLTVAREVLQHVQPDAVFMNMDAGTAYTWMSTWLPELATDYPTLLYAPLEGSPVDSRIAEAFTLPEAAATYTIWSANRLKAEFALDVIAIPHAVDTSVFHPLDEGTRCEVRRQLGWEGRFVVMYVAQNRRRKNHERLIRALGRVHERGRTDVLLYLHCKPEMDAMMDGWNLRHLAHCAGVAEHVYFPDQDRAVLGEAQVTLAAKYAAADLYVHPAGVEGFGLPLLEAMASGTPVVIPDDQGNMSEVVGDAALCRVSVADWEAWHTGALLANCAPEGFAAAIVLAQEQPAARRKAAARGLARAQAWPSWQAMGEALTTQLEQAVERWQNRRSVAV